MQQDRAAFALLVALFSPHRPGAHREKKREGKEKIQLVHVSTPTLSNHSPFASVSGLRSSAKTKKGKERKAALYLCRLLRK